MKRFDVELRNECGKAPYAVMVADPEGSYVLYEDAQGAKTERAAMSERRQDLSAAEYVARAERAQLQIARNVEAEQQVLHIIANLQKEGVADGRWLSLAKTDIEKGFMALNRAVAEPLRVVPADLK